MMTTGPYFAVLGSHPAQSQVQDGSGLLGQAHEEQGLQEAKAGPAPHHDQQLPAHFSLQGQQADRGVRACMEINSSCLLSNACFLLA